MKAAAEKSKQSQADFIRATVAAAVSYKGPLTTGRAQRKYADEAERKAAEKERRQLKNKLYKEYVASQTSK